jgi:hypothetical protein
MLMLSVRLYEQSTYLIIDVIGLIGDAYAIGSICSFGAYATGLLPFFLEPGAYATGFFYFIKSKYNY